MIGSERAVPKTMPVGAGTRIALLVGIFFLDKIVLNRLVDFEAAQAAQGFAAVVRYAQHFGFRFLVALSAALAAFAYVKGGQSLKAAFTEFGGARLRGRYLAVHALLVVGLMPLSYVLFRPSVRPVSFELVVALWLCLAGAAVLALAAFLAPLARWVGLARSLGAVWAYALIAALIGSAAMQWSQELWGPTAGVTFRAVSYLLHGVLAHLDVDVATRTLTAEHFAVRVADECSGLEGLGLILAFMVSWLVYFRKEYIFPRALLLIPVGLALIFALNIVRIAALMIIGNAGYPDVAIYGFHSQAGWISFIAVACALAYVSRTSPWLNRQATVGVADPAAGTHTNFTAVYLLPLMTILAAGIVSHSLSGQFESFYPLRLVAALAVLWGLRKPLLAMEWRVSWRAPAVGVLVFVVWWAAAQLLLAKNGPPGAFAAMSGGARSSWLLCRTLATVLTVPFAEELAYRGFLMRRIQCEEFQRLPYAAVRWPALGASSVVFGLMHGAMWLPGVIAGLAYACLARARSSLGEAVMAHATTNALAAVCVLTLGDWRLW